VGRVAARSGTAGPTNPPPSLPNRDHQPERAPLPGGADASRAAARTRTERRRGRERSGAAETSAPQPTWNGFDVAIELLYGATFTYLMRTRHVPLRLSFCLKVNGLLAGFRPPWIVFHFLWRFCCQ
jgi:hypothetical protein